MWPTSWDSSRRVPGPCHTPWSHYCNEPEPRQPAGSRTELPGPPARPPTEPGILPLGPHSGPVEHRRATYRQQPPHPKTNAVSGVTSPRAVRRCRQPRRAAAHCRKMGSKDSLHPSPDQKWVGRPLFLQGIGERVAHSG